MESEVPDEIPSYKKPKLQNEAPVTNLNPEPINDETENPPMSKRQRKKLIKIAQWETKKQIKRLKEREKYKQKRQEAIEKGEPTRIGPSRKELKLKKAAESTNNLKVAVDLNFDDLMIDKDIGKCVKQLLRIYTVNRRSQAPGKLFFTGIKENGKIHKCLEKNDGYVNWDVTWEFNKIYSEIFEKDKIVYLTSDSDNLLDKLDDNCVYVIGGIVDHNHHKGLCLDRAQKLDVKTARLPLNEHVDIKTRTVLSTFHVFEMLLRVSEGKSWQEAILEILPMRKGAKPKNVDEGNGESENSSEAKCNEDDLKNCESDQIVIRNELTAS